MLNKLLFSSNILVLGLLSSFSFANELKTSSLAIVKTEKAATLSYQCQKMFSEGDKLISEVEKQPGTHTQVSKMKDKLYASKQQILQLDPVKQDLSCEKGLLALNNLKKQTQIKQ
ncbi:DUF5339 domain-containing protein [Otariodibacter oris]|uniref:Uncharacterized protein n=1 Tax=Otariodibacter oris TaxID=1032623 RepID=A0A420XH60_9PAST|nr:DUF5339 domain-containing protein [Otariodibacter oris]QGM81291.1 hypothetical protein A6A10_07645 [Otariodibacter oris]RKR72856.1 hypothetical protein DES31_1023 [Otariodibacter oris]